MTRRGRRLRGEQGVAMVEFALVLPLLMLVLVGIFEFGRTFNYWIDQTHLANETARWAVVNRPPDSTFCPSGCTTNKLQLYACANATNGEAEKGLSATVEFTKDGTIYTTDKTGFVIGDAVKVSLAKTVSFPVVGGMLRILGGSGFGTIQIRGKSTMRMEQLPTNYAGGTVACP